MSGYSPAQSGLLEEEDVRGGAGGCAVVAQLRVVLAGGPTGGRATSARVDAREVEVGVDDAEDEATPTATRML